MSKRCERQCYNSKTKNEEQVVTNGQQRSDILRGLRVAIVLKKDQRSGIRTVGVVKDILSSAPVHHRGIKVRLEDGQIGRVQEILRDEP
jgi:uncharacterized repeat protein (TIGR03833 family)